MNILICGKNTLYTKSLAERLKREKNEIHYISGSKAAEKIGSAVFQQFDFEYTNPNIGRIVKSAKPDVMILLGSSDRNYSWRNPSDDAMTFVAGMSALMMAGKGCKVKRIIFVSSIDVFENNTGVTDPETPPQASSPMYDAFFQAENLCRNFADEDTEIDILRLPQVTGFNDENALNDYCLIAARTYLGKSTITYTPGQVRSTMFYLDAVDAIIKLLNLEEKNGRHVFQLQGVTFTEEEFAEALSKTNWNRHFRAASPGRPSKNSFAQSPAPTFAEIPSTAVNDAPTSPPSADEISPETGNRILRKAVFGQSPGDAEAADYTAGHLTSSDEAVIGSSPRYGLHEIADKLCKACMIYKKQEEKGPGAKLHVLPMIEAVAAAALVTLVTYFLRKTWVGDSFSIFTLYSILFGAVYGTTYGLLAGLLSTVGTLIIQWNDAGLINTLENYVFFLCFLQFVLAGVIAGYMRDKFARKTNTLTEEKNYLAAEVADLTRINDNNIYVKNVYEKRLVGYENSLPRLYELTSQLDYMEPEKVIFHAAKVTRELLEVEDVAIYMAGRNSRYFRLNAATSEKATICGKSFKYDEEAFLFSAFEQKEIYRNNKMDETKPVFAGAVMEEDNINAIIMVWTGDIHKINQYESDMLAIVCRLIQNSMSRANLYMEATRSDSYIEGTRIVRQERFLQQYYNFSDGRRQEVFDFSMLKIEDENADRETVQKMIRDTDVLGEVEGMLYIMLPFSNDHDAGFVINRFAGAGINVSLIPAEEQEYGYMEGITGNKGEAAES